MALLEIEGLNLHAADVPLVQDLSLRLEAGKTLGLVGESGSGKSLTALAVMQLLPHAVRAGGQIRFDGTSLNGLPESAMVRIRGQGIGMVFQEPMTALNPLMSIGDQVAETVRVHRGVGRAEALKAARLMLNRVGLDAARIALERYPHELSGGQRQRVAIAMAVVLSPRLLIADEPTTALDVSTQAEILTLLKNMVRQDGSALLLISHDLAVISHMCERVVILRRGALVDQGETGAVLRDSQHPYTRSLVSAATPAPLRDARLHASAPAAAAPLLEVRDVICSYGGFRAVDGVSLTVMPGESVGLVGESGSGKSTLLRSILGVQGITSGHVRLDGESIVDAQGAQLRRLRRMIQCVFQDPVASFDPRWRVERLIAEPLHLLDSQPTARERRGKVEHLLDQVGLSAADADRYPHEFSGGQRQRIAIARALIVDPALIALDEAVSALDAGTRAQILSLLAQLSTRLGVAYLFVSHDLGVVRSITDRVYVLKSGRIVESGATAAVFDAPAHAYTKALLNAVARFE
jgi:peptide/nickel transport system ATP-binding protein